MLCAAHPQCRATTQEQPSSRSPTLLSSHLPPCQLGGGSCTLHPAYAALYYNLSLQTMVTAGDPLFPSTNIAARTSALLASNSIEATTLLPPQAEGGNGRRPLNVRGKQVQGLRVHVGLTWFKVVDHEFWRFRVRERMEAGDQVQGLRFKGSHLRMLRGDYLLSATTNYIPNVDTNVVRRRLVYMGTETPRKKVMPST